MDGAEAAPRAIAEGRRGKLGICHWGKPAIRRSVQDRDRDRESSLWRGVGRLLQESLELKGPLFSSSTSSMAGIAFSAILSRPLT